MNFILIFAWLALGIMSFGIATKRFLKIKKIEKPSPPSLPIDKISHPLIDPNFEEMSDKTILEKQRDAIAISLEKQNNARLARAQREQEFAKRNLENNT